MREHQFMMPLSRKIRRMRDMHERESLRLLNRQMEAQERIREVSQEVASGKLEMAAQIPGMMMQVFQNNAPDPVAEERDMREADREDLAYGYAHMYFDKRADGSYELIDFAAVLDGMESIVFNAPARTFTVARLDGDVTELKGDTSLAFTRYLIFLGVFEALDLRKACPVCAPEAGQPRAWHEPGMDPANPDHRCPECNGLAWILDDGTAVES